jgi:hypothetical protein
LKVDKGLKRLMKGRLRIVAIAAVCLMIVALPAAAFGAVPGGWTASPADGQTLITSPVVAGVTLVSATALNASNVAMTIDGAPTRAYITPPNSVTGTWDFAEVLDGGNWVIRWTWTPGSSGSAYTVYCYPSAGSHTIAATLNGVAGSWSYTVDTAGAKPSITSVSPGIRTVTSDTTPDIAVTVVGGTAPVGVVFEVNGTFSASIPVVGGSASYTPLALADGSVNVTATATAANGSSVKAWTFYVYTGAATNLHAAPTNQASSACVVCHPGDLTAVHGGCSCHDFLPQEEFDAAALAGNSCNACHAGQYAAHQFEFTASGHSTVTYGNRLWEKFDGTGGSPVLKVEAEEALPQGTGTWPNMLASGWTTATLTSMPTTYNPYPTADAAFGPCFTPTAWVGTAVTAGSETTMTSKWDFPTAQVFWSDANGPVPGTAVKDLDRRCN